MTLADLAQEGRAPLAVACALSANTKIGEAASTYAAQASCPSSCPFLDGGGCYAESGQLGKFVTDPLNTAARDREADELDVALAEARAIVEMDVVPGRPMRLHTVGDCSTTAAAQIVALAAADYRRRGGGPVWTYTHAWREVAREAWGAVSVLASCETAADVQLARERGYAPSIVVEEFPGRRAFLLDSKEKVVPCPAQTTNGVSCSSCRLCLDDARLRALDVVIGFELHGIPYAIRQARRALRNPADPLRRLTAEEQLRRLLAERPTLTAGEAARELDMNAAYAGQLLAFLRGHAEHPSVLRRRRYDRPKVAA